MYDQYDDGTIVIVDGPHNVGEVYPPGGAINRAITEEIGVYPTPGAVDEAKGPEADDERAWYDIPTSLAMGEVDWIQERVDDLTDKAKAGEEFQQADREFLVDLYWWIGAGGYAVGMPEASQLQRHYVVGDGGPVEIDAEVYEQSVIVQYAMRQMKQIIRQDLEQRGVIRNDGEIWSTEVLSATPERDQNDLGTILDGGYLQAEQGNIRLMYTNNRFALKSFSERLSHGEVVTRWRVDDVWDFASFEERAWDVSDIPLRNDTVLHLPDGLSEYMTHQGIAREFEYWAQWAEAWDPMVGG